MNVIMLATLVGKGTASLIILAIIDALLLLAKNPHCTHAPSASVSFLFTAGYSFNKPGLMANGQERFPPLLGVSILPAVVRRRPKLIPVRLALWVLGLRFADNASMAEE